MPSHGTPGAHALACRLRTQPQAKVSSHLEIDRRGAGTGIKDKAVGAVSVKHASQYDLIVEKIEGYFPAGVGGERGHADPGGDEKGTDVQPHTSDCEADLFPCPAWLEDSPNGELHTARSSFQLAVQ